MNQFKQEELVHRNGQTFPKVSGRLRLSHEENENLSITTELINFSHLENATVRASVTTEKGVFSAYGCASSEKDQRLVTSLLELAETRAIARALRFAGYGVECTGSEEISEENTNQITQAQKIAIESIASSNGWSPIACCKRILKDNNLDSLNILSKHDANLIISNMKDKSVA